MEGRVTRVGCRARGLTDGGVRRGNLPKIPDGSRWSAASPYQCKFRCDPKDRELLVPQRLNRNDPSRADCRQPYCH
jgi:hypothetical protein